MDLNQILVFVRVVQAGSFSAAARHLGLPKSTVSRKISELEERMGARLLQRTTRKLSLTDAGRIYYERTAAILGEIEEAEQAVGRLQAAPRGLLRVTVPLGFDMLGPIVAEFLERHPDVQIQMVCTDRRVDLVEERFDMAIRAGPLQDSMLVARHLGTAKTALVAAPSYCKRHGIPQTPADLQKHSCVAFGVNATPNVWIFESGGKRTEVRITPRLTVNDQELIREAVLAGVGIAWLPEHLYTDGLRKGHLRRLLPEWGAPADVPVHALYPTTRQLSPKVVAFIDLVAKRIRIHG
ncbi:LysR family transcriptional regulator [Polyangium mundeleinium]|uniref:LysR family transcriptional regulator n=1 Tax=Polyangium mundeleinium TaxID=2995306 RepID=A0ABT5ET44_9BACT|nr:LysR family transcriptional regulator [Polyangium mundeleinium]MDC0744936.1 LysR family transcriptional regulator [Polyangium mundeleinium]